MPNVQQISKGKGKGRPTSCICGRRGTAAVQFQHTLNLGARKVWCSGLSSGHIVPRKDLVYILHELGGREWTNTPHQRDSIPGLLSPVSKYVKY